MAVSSLLLSKSHLNTCLLWPTLPRNIQEWEFWDALQSHHLPGNVQEWEFWDALQSHHECVEGKQITTFLAQVSPDTQLERHPLLPASSRPQIHSHLLSLPLAREEGKGKFRSIHISTSVSVQSLFVEDKT